MSNSSVIISQIEGINKPMIGVGELNEEFTSKQNNFVAAEIP